MFLCLLPSPRFVIPPLSSIQSRVFQTEADDSSLEAAESMQSSISASECEPGLYIQRGQRFWPSNTSLLPHSARWSCVPGPGFVFPSFSKIRRFYYIIRLGHGCKNLRWVSYVVPSVPYICGVSYPGGCSRLIVFGCSPCRNLSWNTTDESLRHVSEVFQRGALSSRVLCIAEPRSDICVFRVPYAPPARQIVLLNGPEQHYPRCTRFRLALDRSDIAEARDGPERNKS